MVLQLSSMDTSVYLKEASLHSSDFLPSLSPTLFNILLNSWHCLYHSYGVKNLPACELRSVSCILSQSFASDLLLSARLIKRWEPDFPLWHQQGQSPARSHSCYFSSLQSISNAINLKPEMITCPALACSTLILLPMQCHSIHC